MPPRLKQRQAGERPPPAPPAEPEPNVSEPETFDHGDVILIDDEAPSYDPELVIDVEAMVQAQRTQASPPREETPKSPPTRDPPKRRENPFLPRYRFMEKISP